LTFCASLGVHGWGQEGHAIIAQIASTLIKTDTQALIKKFLPDNTLASIASLADDYRETSEGKWSAPLHFLNVEDKTATSVVMSRDCSNGFCVVMAVQNYTNRFTNDAKNPFVCNTDVNSGPPCALAFLVHFAGDIHQPLHCGYAYDEGGNEVQVTWFGQSTELHAVWDVSIIDKWNSDFTSAASQLISSWDQNEYTNTTESLAMAQESFTWVRDVVYDFKSTSLSTAYYDLTLPIVKDRLLAAGVRLSMILDSIADATLHQKPLKLRRMF